MKGTNKMYCEECGKEIKEPNEHGISYVKIVRFIALDVVIIVIKKVMMECVKIVMKII